MFKTRGIIISVIVMLSVASLTFPQNEAEMLSYELASNIDISSVKDPVLQLNIDNLGYIYVRTYKKLYLFDCNTTPEGAILATIDLNPPESSKFLVNNKGKMFFTKINEMPVQVFDEKGVLKAALGEMKTEDESYKEVNQVFVDSRGFMIIASPRKILYFDQQGNFQSVVNFERPFRIIHLDNKDNLYVLQQLLMSSEMKLELERLEDNLTRIRDEIQWQNQDIQENREKRDEITEEVDGLIDDKNDKIENLRDYQSNPELNATWIDSLQGEIEDIRKKIRDLQNERKDLLDELKSKSREKKRLRRDEIETAKDIVELKKKARKNARSDQYEVVIYDSLGTEVFSFELAKPENAVPMFNTYSVQSDNEGNFFGVPVERGFELSTVLNYRNEEKSIRGGAGNQVNIYNSSGEYVK